MINSARGIKPPYNVYVTLVLHFGVAMTLFSLCRVGFYLYNREYFAELTLGHFIRLMGGGLRFDLTALLYLNSLYILFYSLPLDIRFNSRARIVFNALFVITNSVGLAANIADTIYYRFTLRRTTYDVFAQFQNEQNLGRLTFQFLADYWVALLVWLFTVGVCVATVRWIRSDGPRTTNKLRYYGGGGVLMLIIIYFVVIGMRGGFGESTRPITLSNAGQYVNTPSEISIVLNTPFAVMRTMGRTKIQRVVYYEEGQLDSLYSPVHKYDDTVAFRADNVVVIVLESFSKEFIGYFNKDKNGGTYQGYTPFLDSLLEHSLTFRYSYANGRKSIDGLPSTVSSIPSLGVPYFLSPYSSNEINSLASLLKPKGYASSFFHGAPNGSMGFQAFMNVAGFDRYYGMDEYNRGDDSDGIWGIWDEKFFDFYADKLNTFQQPFVSSIFSVSSHHPFRVPQEYEDKFKGGPLVIHKCIEYTDWSLKKFFNKVSKMPWYEHTLFVITADHTSSEIEFDETRTSQGVYEVPIIFFKGDDSLKGVDDGIAQQADIMPSILSYLHYDGSFVGFGNNLLATEPRYALNYKDNAYQLTMGDHFLQFDGTKTMGFFDFKQDPLLKSNKAGEESSTKTKMETLIKAIVQQYNNRMIDNRLTVR